ncbi:MAG: hypothetical protein ACYTG5_07585 [Planctomycetota bacterium]|jgi:tetratricopeptide (TPR) repeat protein
MRVILLPLVLLLLSSSTVEDPPNPFVQAYLQAARAHLAAGETDAAREKVERALERDRHHLASLQLLAEIAEAAEDKDAAVYTWHRWIQAYDRLEKAPLSKRIRREAGEHLLTLDPEAKAWDALQADYIKNLLALGKDYTKQKNWLGGMEVYRQVLSIDPSNKTAAKEIKNIQRKGGKEVAVEDVYAGGGDPGMGMSAEQIAISDAKHRDWSNAYTDKTENYRYRTNAGYTVLKTAAIAMEQMNGFYRRFFHHKEKGGKTPMIEIRIFRTKEEYLELGSSPKDWSGGQFTGSAVETYVGGVTGQDSIRGMYRTLFHEASHQFKALTSPAAPAWINEGFASFFEGCVILSNSSVKWNQAPPGRLIPLARRLEQGFMATHSEAHKEGEKWITPETAPPVPMIVGNEYTWGPPWYAPTWGVVYFLYNYRSDDGQAVYRTALDQYFKSFKSGRPNDAVAHFEEIVLRGSPLSPVKKAADLTPIWRDWILALRDSEVGRTQDSNRLKDFAKAALERGDKEAALAFFEEAREDLPHDPEILWQMAVLLEDLEQDARSAALYREFKQTMELNGDGNDPSCQTASDKVRKLDPLAKRLANLRGRLAEKGLNLARNYEARGLNMMALEIVRRMSGSFSLPEALDYYSDLAKKLERSLASWRIAYNEANLGGWAGAVDAYQAYGAMIRSDFAEEEEGTLLTKQLICDVTFDSDYSLEAEMRIEPDGKGGFLGSLMGLCFGLKGSQEFHAVILHPKGFMDVSTNRGGEWQIHDHRTAQVGSEWRKLRIDVTGNTADFYLDGKYVRPLQFPNESSVRGGFGLLSGPGVTSYRNIRILERPPFDPAARIEREMALAKLAEDSSLRQGGNFTGMQPPPLDVKTFVQGDAVALADLTGKPVMLAFWTPAQDKVIPCTEYLAYLIQKGASAGLETIVLCDGGTVEADLRAYLEEHPIPGARIAIDKGGVGTYDAYWVKAGHHGIPRVLLINPSGKVSFEGDPGLKAGEGWKPGQGPTYLDTPFDRLLGSR